MAHAVKEASKETIEIIDQLKDNLSSKKKRFNAKWLIPATLVVASATSAFFVVRRVLKNKAA